MKNYKKGSAKIVLLIILILVIAGGIYYWKSTKNTTEVKNNNSQATSTVQVKSEYSFKTIKKEDENKKYPGIFVEIYKNNNHLKTLSVMESGVDATNYVVSPDSKKVAFKTVYAGGTCVYFEQPNIINLDTLSHETFHEAIRREIIDVNIVSIKTIKWTSDSDFELGMEFGEKNSTDCGPYSTKTLKFNINQKD
jgi:hypothetical protein